MTRDPLDRYYTPDALARACLRAVAELVNNEPARVLEPYAGGGAFMRAARRMWPHVDVAGCDVDPEAPALTAPEGLQVQVCPAAEWEPSPWPVPWVVSNPPYRDVYETVAEARALQARCHGSRLGLLLRATVLSRLMTSDDPPAHVFLARQRPRGLERGLGHAQAADVVQQRALADRLELAWRQAQRRDFIRI